MDDRLFQMETLLRFPRGWRSKLSGQRKTPQRCAGVLHSTRYEGFSLSFSGLLKYWVHHDKLLTLDTQCQTYTHLTHTSTLQQFVFSCVNPRRWTPAVYWYVAQSIVVQAKDSRTKTASATVHLKKLSHKLSTSSRVIHISVAWLQSRLDSHYHISGAMSPNHLWHYHPCASLRLQVHSSPEFFHWMKRDIIVRCKKRPSVTGRSDLSFPVQTSLCPRWFKDFLPSLPQMTNNQKWRLYHFTYFC